MNGSGSNKPNRRVVHAVAIVIFNSDGEFLIVKRPDDDPSLAGVWGLPAVSCRDGEGIEDAVRRAGRQKLGIDVAVKRYVGDDWIERERFTLHLSEFEVSVATGEPSVPQDDESVTQYVAVKYADDPSVLVPAAQKGSLCSRIFLRERDLSW